MEYEPISDDELAVVHVRDERPSVVEDLSNDNEEQQLLVHVEYEPRTPLAHQLFTGELSIHVDEPLTPLFFHSPPHRTSLSTPHVPESSSHSSSHRPSLTKKQRKNRKRRARRYDFEVIRHLYKDFTITNVRRILIDMNIHWVNFNIVGHVLFIGLKDERTKQWVEEMLHPNMFTHDHYRRIQTKSRRR
ncbi:unnamed protein product [Didymodactylos carnosus]|uniref:Uncharacterized protein n=1 Tax=Didymodactylos carnosus TaxID=1234261 RepID=A0A815SF82_9BILA|nr:unnamed protein product [Didymodactylos carnosus]CAF4354992.1 unnamed protein product [Didymodactylos carnosus]